MNRSRPLLEGYAFITRRRSGCRLHHQRLRMPQGRASVRGALVGELTQQQFFFLRDVI